jgi:hypothetical protein
MIQASVLNGGYVFKNHLVLQAIHKPNQRQGKPVLMIDVKLLLSTIKGECGWNSFMDSSGYFSSVKNECLFSSHQVLEISTL